MDSNDWFTLEELAARLGALVWVEQELGQILGSWAVVDGNAKAAVLFATAGRHHQWHAQVIGECVPTSPRLINGGVVVAPTTGWSHAGVTLRELTDPDATVARLATLVKVIHPWIERETAALRDLGRPISDAATSRWLRFVGIDHDDDGTALAELHAGLASTAVRMGDHVLVNSLSLD